MAGAELRDVASSAANWVEGIAMDATGGELFALLVLFAVPIGLAAWVLRR